MIRPRRVIATLAVSGSVTLAAAAQTPAPPATPSGDANSPAAVAAEHQPPRRRSVVHHYSQPYPEYYHGDQNAGFRNPGGLGRYLEYYPAGNQFQERGDPVQVAKFDQGGGAPDRAEQLAAQQIGIQRENAIMNHIDRYARPSFGIGYFGGFY